MPTILLFHQRSELVQLFLSARKEFCNTLFSLFSVTDEEKCPLKGHDRSTDANVLIRCIKQKENKEGRRKNFGWMTKNPLGHLNCLAQLQPTM